MTYQVLSALRVKTGQGEAVLKPGQVIRLNPDKAESLIASGKIKPHRTPYELSKAEPIWKNPYPQGTPEALRHTLAVTMDAMLEQAVIDIQEIGYRSTSEAQESEAEVKNLYFMVLDGLKTIADFQKSIDKWKCFARAKRN